MDSGGRSNKIIVKTGAVVEYVKTTLRGEITIGQWYIDNAQRIKLWRYNSS